MRGKVEGPAARSGCWYFSRRSAAAAGLAGSTKLARLSVDPTWAGVGQSRMLVGTVSSESPPKPQIRLNWSSTLEFALPSVLQDIEPNGDETVEPKLKSNFVSHGRFPKEPKH